MLYGTYAMGKSDQERIVISVGGSLIVPTSGIDTDFLKRLNRFIRQQLTHHPRRQFFLVTGGGATARQYRDAGRKVLGHELTVEDLDWLGVHSTRLNAHLIRTIFQDVAHASIINDYTIIRKATEPVVVAAGWKPGWSTDYCATLLCEDYHAKTVVNLSNIKQLYDKDPHAFSDAKPISKISWQEFRAMIGDTWTPGMHTPFDPIAAKKAAELHLKVVILGGEDFSNVANYFDGKAFLGTVIE